tara:strand:+ start:230 stop:715 length:486 start_codon:yes stop_codon:yes gene_type:complete
MGAMMEGPSILGNPPFVLFITLGWWGFALLLIYSKRGRGYWERFVSTFWPADEYSRCQRCRKVIGICCNLVNFLVIAAGIYFAYRVGSFVRGWSDYTLDTWLGQMWMVLGISVGMLAFLPVLPVSGCIDRALDFANSLLLSKGAEISARRFYGRYRPHDEG